MSSIPDLTLAAGSYELSSDDAGGMLSEEPFTGLNVHFGQLIGVQDVETLAAQPRAKLRLHNAWLHGAGVVHGLGMTSHPEEGELRVEPGLALDGCGRELRLDAAACVDVGAWFERHSEDVEATEDGPRRRFAAHVGARFRSCLTRQVPAIAEPCGGGGGGDTAYSRVVDTVELLLMPGRAPVEPVGYHRLRVLFGLERRRVDDADVAAARDAILALPAADQPAALLTAFRRFAALDVEQLQPAAVPAGEPRPIVPALPDTVLALGDLDIVVEPGSAGGWRLVSAGIDISARASHVATSTIQELLCGAGAVAAGADPAAAAGTHIDAVTLEGTALTLHADAPLAPASISPVAITVSTFDPAAGWTELGISKWSYDDAQQNVVLELTEKPVGLMRVVARGTGTTPLLDADLKPIAGAPGDLQPAPGHGGDFVHMEGIAT
jgi:hypothetical protein